MIESVIYFLLISKNNKCEHTCCHYFVCNVSSLTGWTGTDTGIMLPPPPRTVCRMTELLKSLPEIAFEFMTFIRVS